MDDTKPACYVRMHYGTVARPAFRRTPRVRIANIGVHGTKVYLHLENLWDRNITIMQRFTFDTILDAYETFAHAAGTKALKVIIDA